MASKVAVLYHASCNDGFCAAWVARRALHGTFGDDLEFYPVHYGQEPPDVACKRIFLLDFSYKRDVMSRLFDDTPYPITVLDHHKTAQAELESLKGGLRAGAFDLHFDMDKSGGRLAWEYWFPKLATPWLVRYTEDRDLWRWALPQSREVNASLSSYPHDFAAWDCLDSLRTPGQLAVEGEAILRYQAQKVAEQIKNAVEIELDGHKILALNATHLTSEIAGKLAEGRPFGAVYFIRADGKKVWSLRSAEDGVDVSEVAKRHGGGGHKHAAGFEEG